MPDVEIKRGYEVLPDNNVRFGIRVINTSDAAILEVEVILDYNESLFGLEGSKVQNLSTIPPGVPRTAKFVLKPRGCIHKEEIGATVRYKDAQWNRHSLEMLPKEVHCVCPFLKEKAITRADFLSLASSGHVEERGINFEAITIDKLIAFLLHTCQNRLYRVDDVPVEHGRILYLAADAVGEKAYYLLTAVVVEHEGISQVLLRASSDKRHGLTGFLNELIENLRHLVSNITHAREIGVIKKEQVINIIDSVVQRTTFAAAGGESASSVTIKDSVVQRTEIKADETARRRRREEAEKREQEEQERLHKEEDGNMLGIKVADETWIGCALLHLENPERIDFTVMEIVQRVAQENIHGELRLGINVHANLHCVANKVPNPGNYRLLYETQKGRRRLFRDGDTYHPLREGKKTKPSPSEIPSKYHYLLNWYEEVYNKIPKTVKAELTSQEKEEQERKKQEQERLRKEEEEKKARERKAREEAEKKKREQAEQERKKQEQERLAKERKERERLQEKKAKEIGAREAERGQSRTKVFAVIIVLGAALLGYWAFTTLSPDDTQQGPLVTLPTSTPSATPAITSALAPAVNSGNTYTNSIGMEFVLIPNDKFRMGSPSNEEERYDTEGPVHEVTIEKAFYMGSYEVTQAQWHAIMGGKPSHFKGDDLPVESVSWNDVQDFIEKLNEMEGTDKYRLPSEAEWEYTCRAGTTTRYSFGDSESRLGEYAWYDDNSGSKTHPVGQKKPNPWGLYDMHGNVGEWVQDTLQSDYNGAPTDGSAWEGAFSPRVLRGGSWVADAGCCRSANRGFIGLIRSERNAWLGFRLVKEV